MAFPSFIAPDPSDSFLLASIHRLLPCKPQYKERLLHSLGLLDILQSSSSSPAKHGKRRHRKHRSRKCSTSKTPLHYLKPGALAQIRDATRIAARSSPFSECCASKRVLDECDQADMVLDSGHLHRDEAGRGERDELQSHQPQTAAMSASGMSPAARLFRSTRVLGPFCPQRKKLLAFKTPLTLPVPAPITPAVSPPLMTDLDSLPLELLVRIVCNLHHDQLKPAFHVSKRFRQAVSIARQCHFDFTTPDRERQDALRRLTTHGKNMKMTVPGAHAGGTSRLPTQMAPRQVPKQVQARVPLADMQQLAGPLFHAHDNGLHRAKPPSLPCPANRVIASHRVLFYEEQLCQAVAQNSI